MIYQVYLAIEIDAGTPEEAAKAFMDVVENDKPRPLYVGVVDCDGNRHNVPITGAG